MDQFDMMGALTEAIVLDAERSRARLMNRVVVTGWDALSERWAAVLASRTGIPVDELRIGIDIDLSLEG